MLTYTEKEELFRVWVKKLNTKEIDKFSFIMYQEQKERSDLKYKEELKKLDQRDCETKKKDNSFYSDDRFDKHSLGMY